MERVGHERDNESRDVATATPATNAVLCAAEAWGTPVAARQIRRGVDTALATRPSSDDSRVCASAAMSTSNPIA